MGIKARCFDELFFSVRLRDIMPQTLDLPSLLAEVATIYNMVAIHADILQPS